MAGEQFGKEYEIIPSILVVKVPQDVGLDAQAERSQRWRRDLVAIIRVHGPVRGVHLKDRTVVPEELRRYNYGATTSHNK